MKKVLLVTALLTSGLFGFLHGESKFAALGFNDQFKVDTKNALDAAFILNAYSNFDNDRVLAIVEGDWFDDLNRKSRQEVRKERQHIVSLAESGPKVFRKMNALAVNMRILAVRSRDAQFFEWISEFETFIDNDSNRNRDYLIQEVASINSIEAWNEALKRFEKVIAAQQAIIEKYEGKYSEILKILGCSGPVCQSTPLMLEKEL